MFETFSYVFLQQYWWTLIALLGGSLVFLLFVQGGQTLIHVLGKTGEERTMIINALGRKWEFTFTTLVTFGGAFFASFPLFYSTSFGGAYWVWMAILFAFIIQAVAYEYRKKPGNFLGQGTYEGFLLANGAIGTFLIGVAVSTFFTGSEFSVNKLNLTDPVNPVISRWEGPAHGLEAVLNWRNIALGLSLFFLARILGILYLTNSVNHPVITKRCHRQLWFNAVPFLVCFLVWLGALFTGPGFAVEPGTGRVFLQQHKYWNNLLEMPPVTILFFAGIIGVLFGTVQPLISFTTCGPKGIWFAGPGTILTVFALFLLAGFNQTAFYPSTFDLQSSLTIQNSSSSRYTLIIMSYASLLIPFVAAYIIWAWASINKRKITAEEMEEDTHVY
jgi:cytochrome d ubiquinol oxidase subunit II